MEDAIDPVVATGCILPPMTIKEERNSTEYTKALLAAGGLVGALASLSCCVLPLGLFLFGIGGAWIGNLTRLAPYQPYFLLAACACLAGGGWLLRRASTRACVGNACARPLPDRLIKASLVTSTLLVVAAIGFDLLGPLLFS
jgi:mercuric ion transport protein